MSVSISPTPATPQSAATACRKAPAASTWWFASPTARKRAFKGKLDFAENRIDNATGTMRVRARFANPDGILQPGMFGRINVPGSLPLSGRAGARRGDRRRPGPPHRLSWSMTAGTVSAKPVRHGPAHRRLSRDPRGPDRRRDDRRQRADARQARRQGQGRDGDAAARRPRPPGCRNEVRAFLRRPADLRDGPFDRPADRRRHRLHAAAGRAISRDRAADHRRARAAIRAPTPRRSPRPSRRRSSRRSTASRACSTCRPIRRATARWR